MLVLHVGEKPFRRAEDAAMARQLGVQAEHVASGTEAMALLCQDEYDIVLLDLDLPDVSGQELIRHIRAARLAVPVLAFADAVPARIRAQALDAGADDIICGPCDMDELLARMRAVTRRRLVHGRSSLRCGGVELDMGSREVRVNGGRLALSRREYSVLELLFLRKGTILTKSTFLNQLYAGSEEPEMKTIDVIVCRLRKRLATAGVPALIDTVWGSGYVLRDPPATEVVAPLSEPDWADDGLGISRPSQPAWADEALIAA
jgi:two-component system cell cycle response regulator CtrA